MFKIGDTLVCTETNLVELSANSITTGEEYVVGGLWEDGVRIVNDDGEEVGVCDYRFKLKEEVKVEKKECLFKEGQVVWDLRNGRGVVEEITNDERYPVKVRFDLKDMDGYEITDHYTADGRYVSTQTVRSLYFSEPKIEAATEPVFVPVLKEGDMVFAYGWHEDVAGDMGRIVVSSETERAVFDENDIGWLKTHWEFYKLGEKIEFN